MTEPTASAGVRIRALAKINVTLEVLGSRPDGYHEVRTVLQSIALHDTLEFKMGGGAFRLSSDDPNCPTDGSNLVWRAAELLWRAGRRRGQIAGMQVHIRKRIPVQAGLGGGSADAAAALRALAFLWKIPASSEQLHALARQLGADVSFFLQGGTALGVERGDRLYPLLDRAPSWVVILKPPFGISTVAAYRWWDEQAAIGVRPSMLAVDEVANALQGPVAAHYPDIERLLKSLRRLGAGAAAMSGSGSAVFGLFPDGETAKSAADALARPDRLAIVTRTVARRAYAVRTRPY